MPSLATRRLIEATAALEPADRALVNLWVNRGLDDDRLGTLTGMSPAAVQARRQRIVIRLGAELGLPPPEVHDALAELAAGNRHELTASTPSASEGDGDAAEAPAAVAGRLLGPAAAHRTPPPQPGRLLGPTAAHPIPGTAPSPPAPARRRGRWLAGAGLLVLVVAGIIAAVLASGSGSTPRARPVHPIALGAASGSTSAAAVPPPSRTPGGQPAAALGGLPGGLAHAHGAVQLVGRLRLRLTVSDLPAARGGHYEVWLYDSVLDSVPLGRLPTGVDRVTFALPPDAASYRWIDVSFQPAGVVNHSGESELRAPNPAHAP